LSSRNLILAQIDVVFHFDEKRIQVMLTASQFPPRKQNQKKGHERTSSSSPRLPRNDNHGSGKVRVFVPGIPELLAARGPGI
jgi:hypothetical protein